MAKFEAFHWNISSSIDLLFLKSISAISINANPYIPSRFAEKKGLPISFFFLRHVENQGFQNLLKSLTIVLL